jgi:hypothetical protein
MEINANIALPEVTLEEAISYIVGLHTAFFLSAVTINDALGRKSLDEVERLAIKQIGEKFTSANATGHPNAPKLDAEGFVKLVFADARRALDERKPHA